MALQLGVTIGPGLVSDSYIMLGSTMRGDHNEDILETGGGCTCYCGDGVTARASDIAIMDAVRPAAGHRSVLV